MNSADAGALSELTNLVATISSLDARTFSDVSLLAASFTGGDTGSWGESSNNPGSANQNILSSDAGAMLVTTLVIANLTGTDAAQYLRQELFWQRLSG